MDLASVNWFVILIAVAANMLLGYLWYGPFFGKRWRKALGKKEKDIPTGSNRNFDLFLTSLVSTVVLWYIIPISPISPVMTVFWLWTAFVSLPDYFNRVNAGANRKSESIETYFHFVRLIVSAFIIDIALDL